MPCLPYFLKHHSSKRVILIIKTRGILKRNKSANNSDEITVFSVEVVKKLNYLR